MSDRPMDRPVSAQPVRPATLPASITPELIDELVAMVADTATADPIEVVETFSGEAFAHLPTSTPRDVDQAYATARRAQYEWALVPVGRRVAVVNALHARLSRSLEDVEPFLDLIQAESGRARSTVFGELCDVLMTASYYAKHAAKILSETSARGPVPVVSGSKVVRSPRGVVLVIAPWNYPITLSIGDAIPALLAGNAVVIKPDPRTTLSTLYALRLLRECGLPEGLVQVVVGRGPELGDRLIGSADYVQFTGSGATGSAIAERAGRDLIPACLELGGKNPMIVLPDANIADAIAGAVQGVFENTGQICMHIERIYLHESIYQRFRDGFVAAVQALSVGAGYDWATQMGGLISPAQLEKVSAHVRDAVDKGATVATGGEVLPEVGPTFYAPTVLEGVTSAMRVSDEETFGPVVALYRYASIDDAVRAANDTALGLNASVWGGDLQRAGQVARRVEAGSVNVNDAMAVAFSSKSAPHGGRKGSGVGARNGREGLLKYTATSVVGVLRRQVLTPKVGADPRATAVSALKAMGLAHRLPG